MNAAPFAPANRLAGRPGGAIAALADLVNGDPDDLQSVLEVLAITDPLARDAAVALAGLPSASRYRGPNSAATMIPFLRPTLSRFSPGNYGVLYGAESTDTAKAEVSYHHARRLTASSAPGGTNVVLALWNFDVAVDLADVRGHDASIYQDTNYTDAQALGRSLRDAGAAGVLYRSVRRPSGECVGIFNPNAVATMVKQDDWRLVWDGKEISEILRVA